MPPQHQTKGLVTVDNIAWFLVVCGHQHLLYRWIYILNTYILAVFMAFLRLLKALCSLLTRENKTKLSTCKIAKFLSSILSPPFPTEEIGPSACYNRKGDSWRLFCLFVSLWNKINSHSSQDAVLSAQASQLFLLHTWVYFCPNPTKKFRCKWYL